MELISLLLGSLAVVLQYLGSEAHYHPHDRYAPFDPNDGYPQHFCDLNDDEYGRPYLGPFDRYIDESARNPFPTIPSPEKYEGTRNDEDDPTAPSTHRPSTNPPADYTGATRVTAPAEIGCTASNECGTTTPQTCTGTGTVYDSCERRCTCSGGVMINCCRVRKEWRSMPEVERCRYINTVVTASTSRQWKPCFDRLINLHENFFEDGIHNMTHFFPWHRWYLLQLENLLRRIDCRVTVPYWDWSLESQGWQNSVIWNSTCGFGGNGSPPSRRVTTGPFRWQVWRQANGDFLRRQFNGVLPDCASVALAQRMAVSDFETWHSTIQGTFHNSVHCNIGRTMCNIQSSNDPIFFLHHGFIDKLWADWQANGPEFKNLAFFSMNNNPMPGAFGATPSQLYDITNQPGCVRVCIQPPSRPCCTNTSYAPVCPTDMNFKEYSSMKLSRLIHRPFPRVSEEAFKLFHATYEDQAMANRFADLMNDYEELKKVLFSNGYMTEMPKSLQNKNGFVNFDRYLYRPNSFKKHMLTSDYPPICLPYLYGQALSRLYFPRGTIHFKQLSVVGVGGAPDHHQGHVLETQHENQEVLSGLNGLPSGTSASNRFPASSLS